MAQILSFGISLDQVQSKIYHWGQILHVNRKSSDTLIITGRKPNVVAERHTFIFLEAELQADDRVFPRDAGDSGEHIQLSGTPPPSMGGRQADFLAECEYFQ